MSAYLWRLTDHHAVLYTDDRSILTAALAYSRFPHGDLTRATTYHGKNNRVFAWQFTFPLAVWNGLVRHLGRAALTFLDEEKPATRKATPPVPEPVSRKPQNPVAAKPEPPKRVLTSKTAAVKPAAESKAPRPLAAQPEPAPASPTAARGRSRAAAVAAEKPVGTKADGKPQEAMQPKSAAPVPALKEKRTAPVPAAAKAPAEPVVPSPGPQKSASRKPSPTSLTPAVPAKPERNTAPSLAPTRARRTEHAVPTGPVPVVQRGSKTVVAASPVSGSAATKTKTPAPSPAPIAAPRVPSAKPAATAAAPPATRAKARVPAGVAPSKPLTAAGAKIKSAPIPPPATLSAKPDRATAVPAKAAPASLITDVTRPARSSTGAKRVSSAQGELLTVPATASPARPRTRKKVPR